MTKLKTTSIKGKEYVEVTTRLKYFRENYKDYSLESELVELTDDSVIFKAVIKNESGRILATGYAQEYKNSSFINKTSFIENCETSAWGRCLGNLGIGIDSSVATYEEVSNALNNQSKVEKAIKDKFKAKPILSSKDTDRWSKAIEYASNHSFEKLISLYELSDADKNLMMKTLTEKQLTEPEYDTYLEFVAEEYHNQRGNG